MSLNPAHCSYYVSSHEMIKDGIVIHKLLFIVSVIISNKVVHIGIVLSDRVGN